MFFFGPPNIEKMKAKRDVPGLVKALGYRKDTDIQRKAAEALGYLGDPRAVEPLIAIVKDVNLDASTALGKIGDRRAVEPLIDLLKEPFFRSAAAHALGMLKDERAIRPLMKSLESAAEDGVFRGIVFNALVEVGTSSIDSLLSLLEGSSDQLCREAVSALQQLGWVPDSSLAAVRFWIVQQNWEKCIEIGEPAVEPLSVELRKGSLGAVAALGKIGGTQVIQILCSALNQQSERAREAVVDALVDTGRTAVEQLLGIMTTKNEYTRAGAALALGKLGDKRAVAQLLDSLNDNSNIVRAASARALGHLREKRAVEPLVLALNDKDESIREAVSQALGQIGDASAIEPLISRLAQTKDAFIADALGQFGKPAVQPLLEVFQNKKIYIRDAAALALGTIGDARAVAPLIASLQVDDQYVRCAAAKALGKLFAGHTSGSPAVKPLMAVAKDGREFFGLRNDAILALGSIGDPSSVPLLHHLLEEENDYNLIYSTTALALAAIGDARCVPALLQLLNDRNRRQKAAAALVQLYHSGKLKDDNKQMILRLRERITQKHEDHLGSGTFEKYDVPGCNVYDTGTPNHTDNNGIGLDFPL